MKKSKKLLEHEKKVDKLFKDPRTTACFNLFDKLIRGLDPKIAKMLPKALSMAQDVLKQNPAALEPEKKKRNKKPKKKRVR